MFRTPARLFRVLAIAEAITWTLLISALIARAVGQSAMLVTVAGGIHGFVFLAYGATAVLLAFHQRWKPGAAVIAVVSAVVPYATVPAEIWLHRTARLAGEWRLDETDDPRDGVWCDRTMRWLLHRPWVLGLLILVAVAVIFSILLIVGPPGGR